METNWALSVDQCWLQVLQFLVHLIDLLLRCNGFTEIQKAVMDQMGSKPPNSDHDLFWCNFGFGKCFGVPSQSSHWAGHRQLYKIHFSSHVTIQLRNGSLLLHKIRDDTSKQWFFIFFNFHSVHEAPTYQTVLVYFKCWTTLEWLTLSSLAISCVAVRGSGFSGGTSG